MLKYTHVDTDDWDQFRNIYNLTNICWWYIWRCDSRITNFFLQSHIIWAWYLTKVCTQLQHGTAPTFWIALTFSLWPPEMGDPNLNNLTASLEELSLKKQLPLRQTTQKPVLKYNQSMTRGSSQFYNQQKVIAIGKYNI